jgi:AcrR family transcriptional regulator
MSQSVAPPPALSPDESRRRRLLDVAFATFARYGYRKTSMEQVARAAQLSRQGLYLHFPSKEELFRAVVAHVLETGLSAAEQAAAAETTLERRLVGVFSAWVGRFVGAFGADVVDIEEAASALAHNLIPEHEEKFLGLVTKLLKASRLPAAYKAVGINAAQLTGVLNATARGLKQLCTSPADFDERFEIAVRALCLPLKARE